MTTTYGVTLEGFVSKPLDVIKAELEADYRGAYGAGINLTPQSNMGQEVGIMSERLAELWELAEAVYALGTTDGAEGVALDDLSGLTGTLRDKPEFSRVTGTASGTVGTVLAAGRVVSVENSGARFRTLASATIGDEGTVDVLCEAEVSGPVPAFSGTLTVIETPVAGWDTFTNALDAQLGADLESDPALRGKREQELRAPGNAAVDPVREHVLRLPNVDACFVFENDTDTIDADGVPAHALEVLVDGGDDAAIRAAIFASKAGGIGTHGTVAGTVVDSQGFSHTVKHTRPTQLAVYVTVDLVKGGKFPSDGAAQVRQALLDYALEQYAVGSDVIASALSAQVFKVAGVVNVTSVKIGTAPAPALSATLVTAARELPKLDSSRIVVNVS